MTKQLGGWVMKDGELVEVSPETINKVLLSLGFTEHLSPKKKASLSGKVYPPINCHPGCPESQI